MSFCYKKNGPTLAKQCERTRRRPQVAGFAAVDGTDFTKTQNHRRYFDKQENAFGCYVST